MHDECPGDAQYGDLGSEEEAAEEEAEYGLSVADSGLSAEHAVDAEFDEYDGQGDGEPEGGHESGEPRDHEVPTRLPHGGSGDEQSREQHEHAHAHEGEVEVEAYVVDEDEVDDVEHPPVAADVVEQVERDVRVEDGADGDDAQEIGTVHLDAGRGHGRCGGGLVDRISVRTVPFHTLEFRFRSWCGPIRRCYATIS